MTLVTDHLTYIEGLIGILGDYPALYMLLFYGRGDQNRVFGTFE